jgi:hypothetical protein
VPVPYKLRRIPKKYMGDEGPIKPHNAICMRNSDLKGEN